MPWARWARLSMRWEGSQWLVTLPGFVLGILVAMGLMRVDLRRQWWLFGLDSAGAQAFLASIVATLISFIGIAFSVMVLMVQLASAQLSPRVIKPIMGGRFSRIVLTLALFTLGYSFTLLLRTSGERVLQLAVTVCILLAVVTILAFIALLDRVGRGVRFAAIITGLSERGMAAIDWRFPHPHEPGATVPPAPLPEGPGVVEQVVRYQGPTGLIQAFDQRALAALAGKHDLSILALRKQGEHVYAGLPLFRVLAAGPAPDLRPLQGMVVVGLERALCWDPAYAIALLVEVGIRALSPAINDPATAVHCIGGIQQLLVTLSARCLGRGPDDSGRVRIPTPSWDRLVELACTDLRVFAAGSVSVLRRLRAMLDELMQAVPADRQAALVEQLELLDRAAEASSAVPEEQALAKESDPLGLD